MNYRSKQVKGQGCITKHGNLGNPFVNGGILSETGIILG